MYKTILALLITGSAFAQCDREDYTTSNKYTMDEQVYYDDKQEKYFIFAGSSEDIDNQIETREEAGEFDSDDLNYVGTKEQILEELLPMLKEEEE